MKKLLLLVIPVLLVSCQKETDEINYEKVDVSQLKTIHVEEEVNVTVPDSIAAQSEQFASVKDTTINGERYELHTIFPGQHRSTSTYIKPYFGRVVSFVVKIIFVDFTYNLGDVDQFDWNKIGSGFSFGWSHEYNSLRWGGRYNLSNDSNEVAPYMYDNGVRIMQETPMAKLKHNTPYYLQIFTQNYIDYTFRVIDEQGNVMGMQVQKHLHSSNYGYYTAPFYFGGNDTPNKKVSIAFRRI